MGCTSSAVKDLSADAQDDSANFHSAYLLGKRLGQGAFAQVRLATKVSNESNGHKKPKEKAVKILDMRETGQDGRSKKMKTYSARAEAQIAARIGNHANCVRIFEAFIDADFTYLVMEKCDSGLFQYLDQMRGLDERSLGSIFVQMLQGIAHLHSVKVVHRDVKPDNFLVGGSDGHTVKLGDFGLSVRLDKESKVTGVSGTAPFMCPEMIRGEPYDEKVDVWSMAVLVYTLFFGCFPYNARFPSSSFMKAAVLEGIPPKFQPVGVVAHHKRSRCAVDFVRVLLERHTVCRPSAQEALNLEFITDVKAKRHMLGEDLPSLRPSILSAKKAGAFDTGDDFGGAGVDLLLNMMQVAAHGKPLPEIEANKTVLKTQISNLCARDDIKNWQDAPTVSTACTNGSQNVSSRSNEWSVVNSVLGV